MGGPSTASRMLKSLVNRFTPANDANSADTKPGPDGFLTATKYGALFTPTDPAVDGEDCLQDCANCSINYPKKWSIDEDDKLYGEIRGWSRHLIVATGKTDWKRDVEDEKHSVMEAIGKHIGQVEGRLMLSASNIPVPEVAGGHSGPYGEERPTTVLLMPSFTYVENVQPTHVPDLIQSVINTAPTNTTPLDTSSSLSNGSTGVNNPQDDNAPPPSNGNAHSQPNGDSNGNGDVPHTPMPGPPKDLPAGLSLRACPHKYVILICSHATRDARCGQSAPLLRRELERHLRPLGLFRDLGDERPGGVGIYFINHVGGHKYSANMMVYRRAEPRRSVQEQMANDGPDHEVGGKSNADGEAAQCIWLARIRPEDCENLVRFTVLQGKVVKPERQLRGGFDRERGIASW
ncbi:related to sucrose cleavage protein [Ramularia collo-cygni]|uniref:Related to sucrose cleavage protein n=1 Tax=Ramularia collo-cygni TaxID=112498 RepID=A0A2D3VBF0_9PEZI|nr:related to sucrose cleavage protein [Ramularia collo-cygni]CZT24300.1 related to sucrose cleavage protein [Ramularia collo-cygni]